MTYEGRIRLKYTTKLPLGGVTLDDAARLTAEADEELEANKKVIAELPLKTLEKLKADFTFRGHLRNTIHPEDLDEYIELLKEMNK